jgi:hypothetical protein
VDDLVDAAKKIDQISRRACRDEFERRFTVEVMAANYECVYHQLANVSWKMLRPTTHAPKKFSDAALARYAAAQWHLREQTLNEHRSRSVRTRRFRSSSPVRTKEQRPTETFPLGTRGMTEDLLRISTKGQLREIDINGGKQKQQEEQTVK